MWLILEGSFASHSSAKNIQYKSELSNIKNGTVSITEYVMRIKDIVRELAACGYTVSETDQVCSILNGIDRDYDAVHASVSGKTDILTVREVQYWNFMILKRNCYY